MCTNTKIIYNRYVHKHIRVNCGHCPSCLQEKANARSSRIRSNIKQGEICLFVTLTYDNKYVPYIDINDLRFGANFDVPIRRHCQGRYIRYGSEYQQSFVNTKHSVEGFPIDYIPYLKFGRTDVSSKSESRLYALKGLPSNQVGVCYFPDLQDFMKRFRQALTRNFHYYEKFTYFGCSEYGSHTQRPHFHLLLFCPACAEQIFRAAVHKAWPYASYDVTERGIEIARDCASYVASYVNSGHCLSQVLSTSFTRQKHSYSHGFGLGLDSFSLRAILEKIDRRDISYSRRVKFNGVESHVTLPIPKYALSRFFPKFKGYSRLTPDTLYQLLHCFIGKSQHWNLVFSNPDARTVFYTREDIHSISVRLTHACEMFQNITGLSYMDFIRYYIDCWSIYSSNLLRRSLTSSYIPTEHYDNIVEAFEFHSESLSNLMLDFSLSRQHFVLNPNRYRDRSISSTLNEMNYMRKCKQKRITNMMMSSMGHNV